MLDKETYTERIFWKSKQIVVFGILSVLLTFIGALTNDVLFLIFSCIALTLNMYAVLLSLRVFYHFYKARREPTSKKKSVGLLIAIVFFSFCIYNLLNI